MKTNMKLNRNGLFLAICLALTFFAFTVPAEARSTTGWNSYKLRVGPYQDASCISEVAGAVVNGCGSNIGLSFEMVVDNGGWHTITVTGANSGTPFYCTAYSFLAQQWTVGTGNWVNPGQQTTFYVTVSGGGGMTLYCNNMGWQDGVANLNWNP